MSDLTINPALASVRSAEALPTAPPISQVGVDTSQATPSLELNQPLASRYRTQLDPMQTGDASFIATQVGDFQSMVNEALMHQRAGLKGSGLTSNMPLVTNGSGLNSGWTSAMMDSTKVDGLLSLSKGEITTPEQVKTVAQEFEGYFMGMLLKQMWRTIPKSGLTDTTFGSTMYREWYLDEVAAKSAKSNQVIGLANVIQEMLLKSLALNETEPGPFTNALDQLTKLGIDPALAQINGEGSIYNSTIRHTTERQYQSVVNSLPEDLNPLEAVLTPEQRQELNRVVNALGQMPVDLLITGPREQNLTPVNKTDLLGY